MLMSLDWNIFSTRLLLCGKEKMFEIFTAPEILRANLAGLARVRATALREPTHLTIILKDFHVFGKRDLGSILLEIFIVYNDIFVVYNVTLLMLIFTVLTK